MQEHMDMVTDSVEAVHVELRKINGLKLLMNSGISG